MQHFPTRVSEFFQSSFQPSAPQLTYKVEMIKTRRSTFMLFSFQPGGGRRKYFCVYWKGSKDGGGWSTEGCSHLGSNDSHTQCKCSHLSSFAVLVALAPKVQRFMVPYSELDCVQEDSRSLRENKNKNKTSEIRSQAEEDYLR